MIAVQHRPHLLRSRPYWKQLADEVRDHSLEEIAVQLGLERDRHDKHKWRGAGCCISINDNKFFDHYAGQGGVGAINFVMYIREISFQEAMSWLTNGASQWTHPVIERPEEKPKKCNIRDESRWKAAKTYLTKQRGLPPALVEQLHHAGIISVDARQNIMFFRTSLTPSFEREAAIGVSLRGTIPDAATGEFFKGLSPGTTREEGYFWFRQGEGSIRRIVATEAPIDAISYAALDESTRPTAFLSTDGQGAVPAHLFGLILHQGGDVVLAYDCDRQGELMAWQVAQQFPESLLQRQAPTIGKDWNDQLLGKDQEKHPRQAIAQKLWQWYGVAPAQERPAIIQIGLEFNAAKHSRELTAEEMAKMEGAIAAAQRQDVPEIGGLDGDSPTLQQPSLQVLRTWYRQARDAGRSDCHLKQIERVGKAFVQGQPLAERDVQMMAQDTALWEEMVFTIAVQARYLLSALGQALGSGTQFADETYLLYEQDDALYVLAQGRGTPLLPGKRTRH